MTGTKPASMALLMRPSMALLMRPSMALLMRPSMALSSSRKLSRWPAYEGSSMVSVFSEGDDGYDIRDHCSAKGPSEKKRHGNK
jgi:hypothetical protein